MKVWNIVKKVPFLMVKKSTKMTSLEPMAKTDIIG